MKSVKQAILDTISDLCSDFLYYGRKEDEVLTSDELKKAVDENQITIDEMVEAFRAHLEKHFNGSAV